MSGFVVKYTFIQVISSVLAAREPDASIAIICWKYGISPATLALEGGGHSKELSVSMSATIGLHVSE